MAELRIWKRFLWRWRFWLVMGVIAAFPLTHILFPTLFPDWLVGILQVIVDTV